MSGKTNGNKFKGNKQKKGRRMRKEMFAKYDDSSDTYGKIVASQGGKHMSVLLLGDTEKKPITASVRGIHHKKVYFKKDDMVVIRNNDNLYEIWGHVDDSEIRNVRDEFNRFENNGNQSSIIFQDTNKLYPSSSSDEDEEKLGKVAPQQSKPIFPDSNSSEDSSNEKTKSGDDSDSSVDEVDIKDLLKTL
jgi:hypothetical protein